MSEMFDKPEKGDASGCVWGVLFGIPISAAIIFVCYHAVIAFFALDLVWKIVAGYLFVVIFAWVIYQAYKMDKEVNNGTKP